MNKIQKGMKQLKRSLLKVTKSYFDILTELTKVNQKGGHFFIELAHSNKDVAHREVLPRIVESKNILFPFSNCASDTCTKPQ